MRINTVHVGQFFKEPRASSSASLLFSLKFLNFQYHMRHNFFNFADVNYVVSFSGTLRVNITTTLMLKQPTIEYFITKILSELFYQLISI